MLPVVRGTRMEGKRDFYLMRGCNKEKANLRAVNLVFP